MRAASLKLFLVPLIAGLFTGCPGDAFSPYLEFPDYANGTYGQSLDAMANAEMQSAREYLTEHPEDLSLQLVRRRHVPGYRFLRSTVVYGIVKAKPKTVTALVSDYEVFGPHISMTSSARLIDREGVELSSPSLQAIVRYSNPIGIAYVLRQGVASYESAEGLSFHTDWDNLPVNPNGNLTTDIHGFARFEPFLGPNGEAWTLYRYDSFVNPFGRPDAEVAEAQFEEFPVGSEYWAEKGESWGKNPFSPIANVARSFQRYVESLLYLLDSGDAKDIRQKVSQKITYSSFAAYASARENALQSALSSPQGLAPNSSIIWDYAPLAEWN